MNEEHQVRTAAVPDRGDLAGFRTVNEEHQVPAAAVPPSAVRAVTVAVVAGLAVGVATSFLQTVLPAGVAPLANSGAPWALAGMLVVVATRGGAVVGVVTLLAEVAGYYVTASLRGFPASPQWVAFWCAAAVVVGAAVGVAAAWLRDPAPHRRMLAVALPAAVLLGEGAHLWLGVGHDGFAAFGLTAMALGVAAAVLGAVRLGRTGAHRATCLAATAVGAFALFAVNATL